MKVLFRDGRDNLAIMSEVWRVPARWGRAVTWAFVLLPLPIGLALACLSMIRRTALRDRTKLYLYVGVIASALSPLLLNVFGGDIWRFFALTQFSAFLVFVAVGEQSGDSLVPTHWNRAAGYGLTVLAIIGAATAIPLFDGYTVAKPPFLSQIGHVIDSLQGKVPWMQIPTR